MTDFFPLVKFTTIDQVTANKLLVQFGHTIGPVWRGAHGNAISCQALYELETPVGVVTAHHLVRETVGGGNTHLTRENTVELSRLACARPGLTRVVIRLWREFVFPTLGYRFAVSYSDNAQHTGNLYRFDGWKKSGQSKSGPDTRTGRPGRDKTIWTWELPDTTNFS